MNRKLFTLITGLLLSFAIHAAEWHEPKITKLNFQHVGEKEQVCVTYYSNRHCSEAYVRGDAMAAKIYEIWQASDKRLNHRFLGDKFTINKLLYHILLADDKLAMSAQPCEATSAVVEQSLGKRQVKIENLKFPGAVAANPSVVLVEGATENGAANYYVRAPHKDYEDQVIEVAVSVPAAQNEGALPPAVLRITSTKGNDVLKYSLCSLQIGAAPASSPANR